MRAGQAGPALGVKGRLGRSSNSPEFSSHAQGQARIKLTGARDLSTRSSWSVDLAPTHVLHRIRTALNKIQAGALGYLSARDIFGATANREFRRNTIANATRLMPTPQGAEECIINCHALPKRQSHPHLKPGWIIATVACNPE